ncbi:MAG: DUF2007 domain-containing protein [Chloroflexi bacterium]|nr:DUF2007 domain-containing protein [Chloroflexota bacterium]
MNWLRRFFYDADPIEPLLSGLHEYQAEMYKELLASSDIPTAIRNHNSLAVYRVPGATFDLLVKRSDMERAHEALNSMTGGEETEDPE